MSSKASPPPLKLWLSPSFSHLSFYRTWIWGKCYERHNSLAWVMAISACMSLESSTSLTVVFPWWSALGLNICGLFSALEEMFCCTQISRTERNLFYLQYTSYLFIYSDIQGLVLRVHFSMQTSWGATPFLSSCWVTSQLRPGTVLFELWCLQVEHNSASAPEQYCVLVIKYL